MPIHGRKCAQCGFVHSILDSRGDLSSLDNDDIDDLSCPKCHAVDFVPQDPAWIQHNGLSATGGVVFPYFDKALACWVDSPQHKRVLLAERGWIDTKGDIDWEREVEVEQDRIREREREMEEDRSYMEEGPHKAEYLKAQDVISRILADGREDEFFRPRSS